MMKPFNFKTHCFILSQYRGLSKNKVYSFKAVVLNRGALGALGVPPISKLEVSLLVICK